MAVSARFAAPGPTKRKSRSRVSTSFKRTAPLKLAQQWRISYAVCGESHPDRWTRDAEQLCRLFFSGFVDAPTTIKPPGECFMAHTLSLHGKKREAVGAPTKRQKARSRGTHKMEAQPT